MPFSNPAPGATIGRTDQGVDWSNVHETAAPAPGVITGILSGLQGFGTTIIERIRGGYVYTALESSGDNPIVRLGQRVRAGQLTSSGGKGGGIEVGFWNPNTGRAVAAPGYVEGQPTSEGTRFRNALSGGSAPSGGQHSTLAQLWVQAGGSPKLANVMAAIALAESGGRVGATNQNTNGTEDAGLWQINSVHGYDTSRLLSDPLYNAQAAVAIEKSQGLSAWVTYQTGAYKQFLGQKGPTINYGGAGGSRVRPGASGGQGATQVSDLLRNYEKVVDTPRTAPSSQSGSAFQWWLGEFNARLKQEVQP